MVTPRIEIDAQKIFHNAQTLCKLLLGRGISLTGVTKATLGMPAIAKIFIDAGITSLGDSRISNIESARESGVSCGYTLIRSPLLSQAQQVVQFADISLNTEISVIEELSRAAVLLNKTHGILVMIELGDIREGIMPEDLLRFVGVVSGLPNIKLYGIGTNLTCFSGVTPSDTNLGKLTALVVEVERFLGAKLDIVSGGNSASIRWALTTENLGRINNLRIGEALLLGRDPLDGEPIDNLHVDAFTLVTEIIESKYKPSEPTGLLGNNTFGQQRQVIDCDARHWRAIAALGHQDTDPNGIVPRGNFQILGAGSDHLVVDAKSEYRRVGDELSFDVSYSALLRSMASPSVAKQFV